jgi:hypothetical protein
MIARRFSAFGWVAGSASAATALYLISLQVAAERAKLEAVEARIVAAQRDMMQLRTELSTRASYRQLEKWNGETLDLEAPRAAQYMTEAHQLASLAPGMLEAVTTREVPRAQLAAATPTPVPPVPTLEPAPSAPIRTVAYTADVPAARARPVVARETMGEIARAAARETAKRP